MKEKLKDHRNKAVIRSRIDEVFIKVLVEWKTAKELIIMLKSSLAEFDSNWKATKMPKK